MSRAFVKAGNDVIRIADIERAFSMVAIHASARGSMRSRSYMPQV